MKKLTLFLAALASPALAMQTTELIPTASQPVAQADLDTFNGDFTAWTTCIINNGKYASYTKDARYNPFIKDVNAAREAATLRKNNLPKFLQYRSSAAAKAAVMAPTYGCTFTLTPLSMERR